MKKIWTILDTIWIFIKVILFFIGMILFFIGLIIWFQIRLIYARFKGKEIYWTEKHRQYYMLDKL